VNLLKSLVLVLALVFASVRSVPASDIPVEVIDWAESNTVMVYAGSGAGTAFFIEPTMLITACHVVTPWVGVYIRKSGEEKRYPAAVVRCDKDKDLALIQLMGDIPDSVRTIFRGDMPRQGLTTYAMGFPVRLPLMVWHGHWQKKGPFDDYSYMDTNHTMPGDSGSPLVIFEDGQVKVVGVRTSMLEAGGDDTQQMFPQIAFITPLPTIKEFFKENLLKNERVNIEKTNTR